VLIVLEGRPQAKRSAKGAPVDAAVIGIIDRVDAERARDRTELRALVRDAVARHVAPPAPPAPLPVRPSRVVRQHASQALFTLPAGSDIDGHA